MWLSGAKVDAYGRLVLVACFFRAPTQASFSTIPERRSTLRLRVCRIDRDLEAVPHNFRSQTKRKKNTTPLLPKTARPPMRSYG